MKTIYALLTAAFLTIHSTGYAQDITYSGENVSLKVIFSVIQKQSGYGFFYDKNVLKDAKPITIKARNLPASEVLEQVFKNQPLDYSIENKTILVSRKKMVSNVVKVPSAGIKSPGRNRRDKDPQVYNGNPDSSQLASAKSSSINSLKAEILQSKMAGLNNKEFDSSALSSPQIGISGINLTGKTSGSLQAQVKSQSEQSAFNFLKSLGDHRKALFAEGSFLGTTQLTGNFDMRLKPGRNDGLGVRAGLGTDMYNIIMPLSLNYLLGEKRSSFEAGIGVAPTLGILSFRSVTLNSGFLNLGYRYQPANEGLMFRATWTKFTSLLSNESTYDPMISFSVGYSFYKLGNGSGNSKTTSTGAFSGHKKYVFLEFIGNSPLVSANFDIRLKPDRNDGFGLRAGAGFANNYFSLPLTLNYIIGKKRSGFETGIGLTPLIKFSEGYTGYDGYKYQGGKNVVATGFISAGYRLQSYNGFMFRSNVSVFLEPENIWAPWPGISVGYMLNKRK